MNNRLIIRQVASFRGQSIDPLISDKAKEVLYEVWQSNWPEKYVLSGGLEDITCEMVVEVPEDELRKAFTNRKGRKALADEVLKVAKSNA